VPSAAHGAMVRGLYDAIKHQVGTYSLGLQLGLISTGCANYRLSANNKPVRLKQADESFVEITPNGPFPTVVFESGVSEHLTQLQVDARNWLESDRLNVQLVVIMSLGNPVVGHNPLLPTFTVEQWVVDPTPPLQVHTLHSNCKRAICLHTSDWTYAVPQPYSIDITHFYVLNPIPAPLINVRNMVLDGNYLATLRTVVLSLWRSDHA